MSYFVKEIVYTLQGEGANCGRAAVFLRAPVFLRPAVLRVDFLRVVFRPDAAFRAAMR